MVGRLWFYSGALYSGLHVKVDFSITVHKCKGPITLYVRYLHGWHVRIFIARVFGVFPPVYLRLLKYFILNLVAGVITLPRAGSVMNLCTESGPGVSY